MPYPLRHRIAILLGVLLGVLGPFMLPAQSEAATVGVAIGSTLAPAQLDVAPGTTVTWTNNDGEEHRVRSTSGPEEFDSGNLETGESYSYTFAIDGTYNYSDHRDDENPAYFGTVTVSSSAPPTTPPPTTPPPTTPPAPGPTGVSMINETFSPATLTVASGSTVTWTNNENDEHTATANGGSFASPTMVLGNTFSHTFGTAGTFDYFCVFHSGMTGTIVVTGGTSPTTTTTAPPTTPTTTTQPPTTTPPAPASGDVGIIDFAFTPASLTVATGATVSWVNNGALPHTATATDGSFDSGFLFTGDTYSRTFSTAGTFNYLCTLHPDMTASITVTGTSAPPTTSPPTTAPPTTPTTTTQPPTTTPPAPASGDVGIIDFAFTPASLTVSTGATVSWVNNGALPHTATATDGSFDSGFLFTGDTYSRTFSTAGTFNYLCTLHPDMTATITVTGTSAPAPSGGGVDGTATPSSVTSSGATTVQSSGSTAGSIGVLDNRYSPASRTVTAGSTVSWVNQGAVPHTVTGSNGSYDSGFLMPGDSYRRTFNTPGSYNYLCTIHPGMTGSITVTGAATGNADSGAVRSGALDENVDAAAAEDPADEATVIAAGEAAAEVEEFAISVVDLAFDPAAPKIFAGTKVTWTNDGAVPHTVTAADFDSGIFLPGESFARVFDQPGDYSYLCTLHPGMEGSITVLEARINDDLSVTSDGAEVLAAGIDAVGGPMSPGGAIALMAAAVAVIGVALAIGMARFGNALSREEP